MTNRKMFFTMLWGAVFRRRSRAMMAVIASLVGAATLFCLASVCVAVPQQMNEEMRAYGANLIVTPASATGKSQGIDTATVRNVTALIGAGRSVKSAAYRYESVRINSAPYTIAGVDVKAVRALNRHWNVTGDWPGSGNVMVGRDVADALGVKVGSRVTIGYRAADASASASSSASAKSDSDESTETAESSAQGTQSTQTTQGEQTHLAIHHLLNAIDGLPVQQTEATWVAVRSASFGGYPTAVADGLATALFVADPNELSSTFAFDCATLDVDRHATISAGFPGRFF